MQISAITSDLFQPGKASLVKEITQANKKAKGNFLFKINNNDTKKLQFIFLMFCVTK